MPTATNESTRHASGIGIIPEHHYFPGFQGHSDGGTPDPNFNPATLARTTEALLNGLEPPLEDAQAFRQWLDSENSVVLPIIETGRLHSAIRSNVECVRQATTAEALRGYRRELVGLLTVWQFQRMAGAL